MEDVSPSETPSGALAPPASVRLRIIHNVRAGRQNEQLFQDVLALLDQSGAVYEILITRKAGDAAEFVRTAQASDIDVIAIAGGDGTINDALQGAQSHTPPLALIPLGTANVLAHEIGLTSDPHVIVAGLIGGKAKPVHPGLVNGRRFMMMASVGFDAQTVANLDRSVKKRLGKMAYLLETLRTLVRERCPAMEARIDGQPVMTGTLIIQRGRRYGRRFVLAPEADLFKPELHVMVFPPSHRLSVYARLLGIAFGVVHRWGLVEQVTGSVIEIREPAGKPVQADGDIVAQLPIEIKLDAVAISLCVPR